MPLWILYLIALVEWFSTLAVEIIAMRLAIPVVGSSIVLTSIFLWIVLLALSAWYYHGGLIASRIQKEAIPKYLGYFLFFAGVWYVLISFALETSLLETLLSASWNYILTLFVVAILLFFLPVFVASHTIPLLTELLPDLSKGKAAGKMLFASTIGSFLWSVVTSIVLFQRLWVHHTGVRVGASLVFLSAVVFAYVRKSRSVWAIITGIMLLIRFLWFGKVGEAYSMDSAYQNIQVYDAEHQNRPVRIFSLNGAMSSAIYLDDKTQTPFKYITETIKHTKDLKPKRILVIGSAWFVYPEIVAAFPYITKIDTVDIDPAVREVTEQEFLEKWLDSKIVFHPYSARYVVHQLSSQWENFDLIFLDAYNGRSIPDELVTQEFFWSIQSLLTDDGVMIANLIMDTELESDFAVWVLHTMNSIFNDLYMTNITHNKDKSHLDNFVVSNQWFTNYDIRESDQWEVYTDNWSDAELDVVEMLYMR